MTGLSFDQAPPYHAVGRFFITAPVFAMLAALVITFDGTLLFSSFVNFKLIGALHWMTLGFVSMTMFGAMMQMLPVLAGVKIGSPVVFSFAVHTGLMTGSFLFGASYLFQMQELLLPGGALVVFSTLVFSVHIFYKLMTVKNSTHTIDAMRLSVIALMAVIVLGFYMAAWRLHFFEGLGVDLVSVHFLWAFVGWVSVLVMGVSFQVIPMFYVSPEYPLVFRRFVPAGIIALLTLYTAVTLAPLFGISGNTGPVDDAGTDLLMHFRKYIRLALYALAAWYAVITLRQIGRRKRKLPDPSLLFWNTSMVFLILAALFAATMEFYSGAGSSRLILLTGVIFLFGFVFSVINAMMYKIVPFLSWFHLASRGIFDAPTMKDLLGDWRIRLQYFIYVVFLLSLPFALFYPRRGHYATGILLFVSSALLWLNLFTVITKYYGILRKPR